MKLSEFVYLQNSIIVLVDSQFDQVRNTQRALLLIKRFEALGLPNINMHEKYVKLLMQYSRDIEMVAKIYTKSRLDPPIARDLPPVTGKILWARQLYSRIEQPMLVFQANKTILQYPEAKKVIKHYNQMSVVLIEYELLYYRAWSRHVQVVASGLHASIIIKNADSGEYLLNFDPEILVLIREIECMKRLQLEVSTEAESLAIRQDIYKKNFSRIKVNLKFF